MNWNEVPGFFDSDLVYKLAVKTFPKGSTFVEIGSWMGRSTSCLGQLVKQSQKNIKVYAVDTFEGSEEHTDIVKDIENHSTSLLELFNHNIKSCDVSEIITPIQGKSLDVVSQFEDESIDFIFIDASHDYDNVLADITAWYPKLKPGGLIAGDDYALCWNGVIRAVNEYFTDKTVFFLNGNLNYDYSQRIWHWCHFKNSTEENKMKVTLYAICRNEEKNVQKFIENSKKFYDTVVVDTGSTDNTVQLLRDAGITVYEHSQTKEEFDFSVARNKALSYVKTDWAFSLDFNEDVGDFFPDNLDFIANDLTCFRHLRFDDTGEGDPKQSQEVHTRFHRTKNYKWANAVHEVPHFKPTKKFPVESSVESSIKITKKINRSISKELFYLSICEREQEKDSKNWYYTWFIFNHYYKTQNITKSLEYGQSFLNASEAYFNSFRIEVFIKCSILLLNSGDLQKAANYAFHAVSESMNMGEPYLSRAFSYLTELSKQLNNPNITVFATAFNENTLSSPERHQAIDRLFLTNLDDCPSSCWIGHRKFAEWLVSYLKPEVIVDLGVDWGYSTFSFAMPRIGHIYGIDTFEGDEFTGKTGGVNYDYVLSKREKLFMEDNVTFIKGYFDDVAKTWNKKIDILHIDGDHKYESIKNDFETWSKFLSDDGVILMHDTCVESHCDKEYGVKRFFEEIDLPKCTFTHTFGLGIVSKNKELIELIQNNFDLSRPL